MPSFGRPAIYVAASVLLLVLAGCATPPPDGRVLTAGEITAAVTANPLTRCGSVLLGQWRYTGRHDKEGTMNGLVLAGEKREEATGRWRTTGDGLYCRTWSNHWADGKEGCFRVTQTGDALTFDHVSGAAGEANSYTYKLGEECG